MLRYIMLTLLLLLQPARAGEVVYLLSGSASDQVKILSIQLNGKPTTWKDLTHTVFSGQLGPDGLSPGRNTLVIKAQPLTAHGPDEAFFVKVLRRTDPYTAAMKDTELGVVRVPSKGLVPGKAVTRSLVFEVK